MILSRPSWPVFLVDFAQNPPLECKQCCKRIIVLKHRHIFLRALTLNTIKTHTG